MWRDFLLPHNAPHGVRDWAILVLAVAMSVFGLYTGSQGSLPGYEQRGYYFAIGLALVFLTRPFRAGASLPVTLAADVLPALLSIATGLYFATQYNELVFRVTNYLLIDQVVSVVIVLLVLEATRRIIGWAMPILALLFLGYAVYGYLVPAPWGHGGFDFLRTTTFLTLGLDGVFGVALDAAATYLVIYVLFGALLEATGAGAFILSAGQLLFGRFRGGPSKIEVFGSAAFGTISGSAVANVVGSGSFTIPLMKREGYPPHVAAAVEAASSTGGQIMPPVMGAAAFIMAEMIGVPYSEIVLAATLPAALYFGGVFCSVDFEAGKAGMRPLRADERPTIGSLRQGWTFVIPIVVLLFLLFHLEWSAPKAAFYAIVSLVVVGLFQGARKVPALLVTGLRAGGTGGLEAAAATACAGIIVGVFDLTGLGLKLAGLLVQVAAGQLLLLLVLVALTCLILGMGVPTTPAYIMVATMVAPALVKIGVAPIAAHLFVMYFAVVSVVTPPVAVAAYVAAGLAGADPWRTGFTAARLALPGFVIPFVFVYRPGLLLEGGMLAIAQAILAASLAVVALAAGTAGYALRRLSLWERAAALAAGTVLFWPATWTDVLGGLLLVALVVSQWLRRDALRAPAAP
jgi:TRAP transporter 4TM/12TM fusion protein